MKGHRWFVEERRSRGVWVGRGGGWGGEVGAGEG